MTLLGTLVVARYTALALTTVFLWPTSAIAQADVTSRALKTFERRDGEGGYALLTLESGTTIAVMPSDLDGQSLKTTLTEQTCLSVARLTLSSGLVVFVPLEDIIGGDKIGRRAAATCVPTWAGRKISINETRVAIPVPAGQPSSLSTASTIHNAINTRCSAEWRDDFRMQVYCRAKQEEAASALRQRAMPSAEQRTIRLKCAEEWRDDFSMINYCEEQQLKALQSLGR